MVSGALSPEPIWPHILQPRGGFSIPGAKGVSIIWRFIPWAEMEELKVRLSSPAFLCQPDRTHSSFSTRQSSRQEEEEEEEGRSAASG